MDLIAKNDQWYYVKSPGSKIIEYLRRGVPQSYRYYNADTSCWVVHTSYAQSVAKLGGVTLTAYKTDDPYAILHLLPTAPEAIIKAAWREMAKMLHPDCGGDAEQFKRAKDAYEKLISKKV